MLMMTENSQKLYSTGTPSFRQAPLHLHLQDNGEKENIHVVCGFLPYLLSSSSTLPWSIQCSPLHLEDAAEGWVSRHMRARCSGLSLAPFMPSCLSLCCFLRQERGTASTGLPFLIAGDGGNVNNTRCGRKQFSRLAQDSFPGEHPTAFPHTPFQKHCSLTPH